MKRRDYSGANNPNWKGGIVTKKDGRVLVYSPQHPHAHKDGKYVLRYRLQKEQELGRLLDPSEVVHHGNNDPTDDNPTNTEALSRSEHARLHNIVGNPKRILTEDQVREIKTRRRTKRAYAALFGVSKSCIQNIWSGNSWKHIQ